MEASQTCGGVDEFVEAGHGDRAEDGDTVVEAREHGSEEWDTLDEGDGAVDGVDDPLVFVGAVFVGELFAEDAVVGEVVCDSVSDFSFDGLVGDGDGCAVGFVVGGEGVFAEPLEREFGAGHDVGCGEGESGLEFFGWWRMLWGHACWTLSALVRAALSWLMWSWVWSALSERRK